MILNKISTWKVGGDVYNILEETRKKFQKKDCGRIYFEKKIIKITSRIIKIGDPVVIDTLLHEFVHSVFSFFDKDKDASERDIELIAKVVKMVFKDNKEQLIEIINAL